MKKKIMTAAAAVAAASLVLTACSNKPTDELPASESTAASSTEVTTEATAEPAEDTTAPAAEDSGETDATLASIYEANKLDTVLADSGKICVSSTYLDEEGEPAFADTGIFIKTDDGIEYYSDTQVDEYHTYITYKAEGDSPVAGYITNSGDYTIMLVDPQNLSELLSYYYAPSAYGTETVTESNEQDGILMVVVENVMDGSKAADTVYCVEPETMRLVTINQTYVDSDGTITGTQRYSFTYGDDVNTDAVTDVSGDIVNAADAGTLTAVYHPGQSNEFTATYTVAKGTHVTAFGDEGAAYLDTALSNPAYGLTMDSDELTVYVK